MNAKSWMLVALLVAAVGAAVFSYNQASRLRAENLALQARLQASAEQAAGDREKQAALHQQELQRLRVEAQEVHKLRNEARQLRDGVKEADRLRSENQRLQGESQALRSASAVTTAAPRRPGAEASQFPRESWTFAGYGTPESALVSAIWAMREGNSQTYFQSLTPEEQQRIAGVWKDKSLADVASKHQQDVANITNLRVLDRQEVSPSEVVMSVFIEGTGRLEKVSMRQLGGDWKFGGFLREPPK